MNYTVPDNRPFITRGPIQTKAKLSDECKAMNEFLDSHYFSVEMDADSQTPIVRITQRAMKNEFITVQFDVAFKDAASNFDCEAHSLPNHDWETLNSLFLELVRE